jgi:hypothetical protein
MPVARASIFDLFSAHEGQRFIKRKSNREHKGDSVLRYKGSLILPAD